MGFLDKMAGEAKDVQVKHKLEKSYTEIGALVYAARMGRSGADDGARLEELVNQVVMLENAHPELRAKAGAAAGVQSVAMPQSQTVTYQSPPMAQSQGIPQPIPQAQPPAGS